MAAGTAPTPAMIGRAAQWAAELDGDDVSSARRAACESWCAQDERHRLAFERMRALDQRFADMGLVERTALSRAARRRAKPRTMAGGLATLLLLIGATSLAGHSLWVRQYFPDLRTAPGDLRELALEDGSRLHVDTDTALSRALTGDERRVSLFRGRLMAQVARDPARPFVVETADGTAAALGTRFSVARDASGTTVTVIESRVRACATTWTRQACIDLGAGDRARLSNGAVERLPVVDVERASAWSKGWLEADDMPLVAALAELNRYRARPIRFDPAALAGIHITGSYPLRDSDRALAAIATTSGLWISQSGEDRMISRDP